jgi:UDP-4-amino-4,6-dideoxy-N-acetyl-beta-L-altrosamine transaminase
VIPYSRQDISEADIQKVVQVLRSDFLTQGPAVPEFETSVASRVHAKHATSANSATSALHIACRALGLGPGDSLWTVPNTFVASANCGRYCGADVDFVDIDPVTWNISLPKLREKLFQAKKDNRLPKVVVPVHFAGQPPEQEAIWDLAREYGFRVLEDASHAIGASRNVEPVGSCRWSDITVFSFHPVKIITTAEGGMAVTNDDVLAERMMLLRSHCVARDARLFVNPPSGGWYYEQQGLGFNYRLPDLLAVLGMSQLARLEYFVDRRNELANRYDRALSGLPLQLPTVQKQNRSAFHLYVIRVKNRRKPSRLELYNALRENGVGANVHYMPVHLQPYYRNLGFVSGQFLEAEAHGDEAITLPLYPSLSCADQDHVIEVLRKALNAE